MNKKNILIGSVFSFILIIGIFVALRSETYTTKNETYVWKTDTAGYQYFQEKYPEINSKESTDVYFYERKTTKEIRVSIYMDLNEKELKSLLNDQKLDKIEKSKLISNEVTIE